MDLGGLRARHRRAAGRQRPARRPLRPPGDVRGRVVGLHDRLGGLRLGADSHRAGGGPGRAGDRRRPAGDQRDVADRRPLRRTRADRGALGLRRRHGRRRDLRPADRRRAAGARPGRARLAQRVPDQPADRACRPVRRDPPRARVPRRGTHARPARDRTDHDRPRRARAAARRGPPARLAAVVLALPRRRAADPRNVRRPTASARWPGWRTAARARAVQAAGIRRRHADPDGVLERSGVVLPDPGAVPAGRPRTEPDRLRVASSRSSR